MKCEEGMEDLFDCYREIADGSCEHEDDVIIECSNIDFDEPIVPEKGTVRLVDSMGTPSGEGKGRLEIYSASWGSICNKDFTSKSAQVACK